MAESKRILHTQIAEEGLIRDHLLKEFELLVAYLPEAEAAIVETAKTLRTELSSIKIGKNLDLKGLKELEATLQKINETELKQTQLIKAKADAEKALGQARITEIKEQKEKIALSNVEEKQKEKNIKLTEEQIAQSQIDAQNKKDNIALAKAALTELDKTAGSLQRVEAANTRLRIERKRLDTTTREGRARLLEINEAINRNNKYITENSDNLKKQKLNVGNYKDSIKDAARELGLFNGTFGQAIYFTKIFIAELKAQKVATEAAAEATMGAEAATSKWGRALTGIKLTLKSLGIGALVAVVGAIAASFKTTEDGIIRFEAIMNSLGSIIKVFIGRLGQFGSALIDFFPAIFKDISNGFTNIKNDIDTFITGEKHVQLETNNTAAAIDKMKHAFDGMGAAVEKTIALEFELAALRRQNRKDNLKDAEIIRIYASEVEKLNQIADDQTLSFRKREEAAEEALKLVAKSTQAEIRIKQRAVAEAQKELEVRKLQNEDTLDAQEKLAEALDQLDDAETKRDVLKLQGEQRRRTIRIKELQNAIQLLEQTFDKEKEIRDKEISDVQRQFQERQKLIDENDKKSTDKYEREVEKISDAVGKYIDANELIQISDEQTLSNRIKSFELGDKAEDLLLKSITNRKAEIKSIIEQNRQLANAIDEDLKKQEEANNTTSAERLRTFEIELDHELKLAKDNLNEQEKILKKKKALRREQLGAEAANDRKEVVDDKTTSKETKAAKILAIDEKLKNDLLQNEYDYDEQLEQIRKAQLEKTFAYFNSIADGVAEGLRRRNEIIQAADQKEIDFHQRMIEVQSRLAAEGKDNNLAEEIARAEKAEQKKLEDQKRLQKNEETLALIKTFSSVLQKGLESGKPFIQAFGEAAAADGLVQAAFAKLFAGYATGVESMPGAGDGTSDSNLIRASKGESVVTAKATKETKGLVTAMNKKGTEGVIEWVFSKIFIPQFKAATSTGPVVSGHTDNSDVVRALGSEIGDLKRVIAESKSTTNTNLGKLGEWAEEVTENGVKLIKNFKKQNGRRSLRING